LPTSSRQCQNTTATAATRDAEHAGHGKIHGTGHPDFRPPLLLTGRRAWTGEQVYHICFCRRVRRKPGGRRKALGMKDGTIGMQERASAPPAPRCPDRPHGKQSRMRFPRFPEEMTLCDFSDFISISLFFLTFLMSLLDFYGFRTSRRRWYVG
jgi:hypothetical protein